MYIYIYVIIDYYYYITLLLLFYNYSIIVIIIVIIVICIIILKYKDIVGIEWSFRTWGSTYQIHQQRYFQQHKFFSSPVADKARNIDRQ